MDDDTPQHLGYAKPRHYRHDDDPESDDRLAQIRTLAKALKEAPRDEQWAVLHGLMGTISRNTPEQRAAARLEDRRRRSEKALPNPTPVATVYYIRFGDRVKIGYTTNLRGRLQAIPHDEVLATEPGDMQHERNRHVQFADLRVIGEWFRYEEPLISHIKSLKSA